MNIQFLLYVLAAICFALDAARVTAERINWTPLGFCFITLAVWII